MSERDSNMRRRPPPPPPPSSFNLTGSPTPPSKLPRRIAVTTNTSPAVTASPFTPATKWVGNSTNRTESVEKSTSTAKTLRPKKDANMTPLPSPKLDGSSSNPSTDKPLPSQKALPSRPVARLSNSLSPTKDGRSLIDASGPPLHITSVGGDKLAWPALRPQSYNAAPKPTVTSSDTPLPDTPSLQDLDDDVVISSAVTNATAALTSIIGRHMSSSSLPADLKSSSPPSSYASANENLPTASAERGILASPRKTRSSTLSIRRSPRKSVLSTGINAVTRSPVRGASVQSSTPALANQNHRKSSPPGYMAPTESSTTTADSPTRSQSRQHSPSPASFSRPRPERSLSKRMRTASRIPLPDIKKATVVDVPKNRLSTSSAPRPALSPSFGSRRLASPDALKILENGKLRRLKRMPTDASLKHGRTDQTWETESNATTSTFATPSLSHSIETSPEATMAANSPEDSPFPLPVDARMLASKYQQREEQDAPTNQSFFEDSSHAEDGFSTDGYLTDTSFTQSPPPTSPWTLPLETIPSQALLTLGGSQPRNDHYDELVRALSHLEGTGSPPTTDVDPRTLLNMFGHVKRDLENYPQESMVLAEHAAVAEKYLAKNASIPISSKARVPDDEGTAAGATNEDGNGHNSPSTVKTILVSKWSDSTPSDKALSPQDNSESPLHTSLPVKARQPTAQSKVSSNGTISIGYPSAYQHVFSNETAVEISSEVANPPTVYRRRSSPTLGGREVKDGQPGSIKAAREALEGFNASYAHMTASATAKRGARMPTPNTKIYDIPEPQPRRKSSMRKNRPRQSTVVGPKTPRSQSKSRFVLDKINGIFAGKRDRKSQEVPVMPPAFRDSNARRSRLKPVSESASSTPAPSTRGLESLPKMPSRSPEIQTFLTPSAASQSSVGVADDGDAECQTVADMAMRILEKAKKETNMQSKARLLNCAKVLNDAMINVREAQISAETALNAARNARVSYEMTLKSLQMMRSLASSMARPGRYECC